MKKVLRIAAVFSALALMTSFIACSTSGTSDDDDGSTTTQSAKGSTDGSTEKINLTIDVTSLSFSEMTSGLSDTAESTKNELI